jgi:hypothetical protein
MKKRRTPQLFLKHGFKKYLTENYLLLLPTGTGNYSPALIIDYGMNRSLASKIMPRTPQITTDQWLNFLEQYHLGLI